jgi:hypothetical protein
MMRGKAAFAKKISLPLRRKGREGRQKILIVKTKNKGFSWRSSHLRGSKKLATACPGKEKNR